MTTLHDYLRDLRDHGLIDPGSPEEAELAALDAETERATRVAQIRERTGQLSHQLDTAKEAAKPELVRLAECPTRADDVMIISMAYKGGSGTPAPSREATTSPR